MAFIKLSGYWQDVIERAAWTFLEGYYAAWTVASLPALIPTYETMFTAHNWQTGVAAMGVSIIKSRAVKSIGNRNSASVLSGVSAPTKPVKPIKKPK